MAAPARTSEVWWYLRNTREAEMPEAMDTAGTFAAEELGIIEATSQEENEWPEGKEEP